MTQQPYQNYGQYPYQAPPPPPQPTTSGTAVAGFILSLLGLIGILPILGSILGLILGYSARNEINRSGGAIGGRGLAQWGIILGWVGLGIIILVGCLVVAGFLTIPAIGICASFSEMRF